MTLNVWVPGSLKDAFKKSSPGVYSLIGLTSTCKVNNAIVLDAVKSDSINLSNVKDPETCLTSMISHVVAGVQLIGFLITFHSQSDAEKGDSVENLSPANVRSSLSKALLNLSFQLTDLNKRVLSLIGSYYDLSTEKLQSLALETGKNKVTDVNSVDIKTLQPKILDSFVRYQVCVKLDLKLASAEFADYNSVLEKIADAFKLQLDPRNCFIVLDDKCLKTRELVSKDLPEEKASISFDIFKAAKFPVDQENGSGSCEILSSRMSVQLTGKVSVLGVLNRSTDSTWEDVLSDIAGDLTETIFFRMSQVFNRTGLATSKRSNNIALPARTFLTNEESRLPILAGYDESQVMMLAENSLSETSLDDNNCNEEVINLEVNSVNEAHEEPNPHLMMLINTGVVVGLISLVLAYLSL